MSRRSKTGRLLDDQEVAEHLRHSLTTLDVLVGAFDAGRFGTVFSMATEVMKILTSGAVATRLRGDRQFRTYKADPGENLHQEMKLIGIEVDLAATTAKYVERIDGVEERLKFRDWWHGDVIYRASVAGPDVPRGLIPIREEDQVPFHKRETLVRLRLVELMRNKFGAHVSGDSPEILDELQRSDSFAVLQFELPDGKVLSNLDGTLNVLVGPRAAMMRVVAGEVLQAHADMVPR